MAQSDFTAYVIGTKEGAYRIFNGKSYVCKVGYIFIRQRYLNKRRRLKNKHLTGIEKLAQKQIQFRIDNIHFSFYPLLA